MPVMEKLKMFVVQEPVVAASCLIGGIGTYSFLSQALIIVHFFHFLLIDGMKPYASFHLSLRSIFGAEHI